MKNKIIYFKHIGKKFLFICFLTFFSLMPLYAEIIFQDDFDSYQDTNSESFNPTGWVWRIQDSTFATVNGINHYSGEISSPGYGGTGKSLKLWRAHGVFGGYTGSLDKMSGLGSHNHWFMSFWWKLPIAFNCTESSFKLGRFNTSSGSGEIYLNFIDGSGTMRTSGHLGVYDGGSWITLLNQEQTQELWNGNWHFVEFEFDTVESILRLWVDGNVKYSNNSFPYNASGSLTALQHFFIGNTLSHEGSWQSNWQAMEFDNFILSTTYIEYSHGNPNTSLQEPQNFRIQ